MRPPLGALYSGLCHAAGEPAPAPPELLTDCCNMGYARGRCPRLEASAAAAVGAADAMRYQIARWDGGSIEVSWLQERGCLPVAHGSATFDRASRKWSGEGSRPTLLRIQLDAFRSSHEDDAG